MSESYNNQSATIIADTEFSSAASLADATSNPITTLVGAMTMVYNGTTWDRVRGDTSNGVDVDVTRVIPGTGATNAGKAIDSVAGATDTGVAALVVRDDALSTLTPVDGDYVPLRVDSQGSLWASLSGPVSLNATKTDAASFTIGIDQVMGVGYLADEAATDSVDEGDIGISRMSLDRIQYVRQNPPTTTHTTTSSSVGDSASSVTLLAANTSRTGAAIRNDSTAILYVELGSTATTSSVVRLTPQAYYELPILAGGEVYRGIITGIWDSDAGGNARISESV